MRKVYFFIWVAVVPILMVLFSCDNISPRVATDSKEDMRQRRSLDLSNLKIPDHDLSMHIYSDDQLKLREKLEEIFSNTVFIDSTYHIGTFVFGLRSEMKIPLNVLTNPNNYNTIDMVGTTELYERGVMAVSPKNTLMTYFNENNIPVYFIHWDKYSPEEIKRLFSSFKQNKQRQLEIDSLVAFARRKTFLYVAGMWKPYQTIKTTKYMLADITMQGKIDIISKANK